MMRSIIILPVCKNMDVINDIRAQFDPLAACIAPHITIIFPFEIDDTDEVLRLHMCNALAGINKFVIGMQDITGDYQEGYLFLNVKRGNDQIIHLHDRLYTGVLKDNHCKHKIYHPHLTVGRVHDKSLFNHALAEPSCLHMHIQAEIDQVFLESIDADQKSHIVYAHKLKKYLE